MGGGGLLGRFGGGLFEALLTVHVWFLVIVFGSGCERS